MSVKPILLNLLLKFPNVTFPRLACELHIVSLSNRHHGEMRLQIRVVCFSNRHILSVSGVLFSAVRSSKTHFYICMEILTFVLATFFSFTVREWVIKINLISVSTFR